MTVRSTFMRGMSLLVASVFLLISVAAPAAQAGMIGTRDYLAAEELEGKREQVLSVLQQQEVRAQLERWGVDPAEAEKRVHSLTAEELEELAHRMEDMPAGAGLGTVVGAAVFVFLVLLITDLLGLTNVFPFTNPQR
ncbi:MAG: PA2779 family protein [Ectothiorhodospiraceae bacterium]|nr:PA2779 family protein [Ectothiorhodospiraceae bacterium]